MLSLLNAGCSAVHHPDAKATWLSTIASMKQHKHYRSAVTTGVTTTHSMDHPWHHLQLKVDPLPIVHTNTALVTAHIDLVRTRLAEYIQLGAVVALPSTDPPPLLVQPLHVIVKAGKKPRLVIDLSRNLNALSTLLLSKWKPFVSQCTLHSEWFLHQARSIQLLLVLPSPSFHVSATSPLSLKVGITVSFVCPSV